MMVRRWALPPISNFATAPIIARSAPMLMVLATNSMATSSVTTYLGKIFPMFAAKPTPVTRPI